MSCQESHQPKYHEIVTKTYICCNCRARVIVCLYLSISLMRCSTSFCSNGHLNLYRPRARFNLTVFAVASLCSRLDKHVWQSWKDCNIGVAAGSTQHTQYRKVSCGIILRAVRVGKTNEDFVVLSKLCSRGWRQQRTRCQWPSRAYVISQ